MIVYHYIVYNIYNIYNMLYTSWYRYVKHWSTSMLYTYAHEHITNCTCFKSTFVTFWYMYILWDHNHNQDNHHPQKCPCILLQSSFPFPPPITRQPLICCLSIKISLLFQNFKYIELYNASSFLFGFFYSEYLLADAPMLLYVSIVHSLVLPE